MNEEMIEKRAKKLLDFLARRIGAKEIKIYCDSIDMRTECYMYWNDGFCSKLYYLNYTFSFYSLDYYKWSVALKNMLDVSSYGYNIYVYDDHTHRYVNILLANYSFEKLLVEYDLSNEQNLVFYI